MTGFFYGSPGYKSGSALLISFYKTIGDTMPPVHPEVSEFVSLPEFTHWLLIPATDQHFPFLKAVILDSHSCRKTIESKGIRVYPIGSPPQGYPTRPIYRQATKKPLSGPLIMDSQ